MLLKLFLVALIALSVQPLCSCANVETEKGVVDHAIKYATCRTLLDSSVSSVFNSLPDADVEVSLLSLRDRPDGQREIELAPAVISDTMASWDADEWALYRDDLFFNFCAHFNVVCKQAHEYSEVPESYVVTCPSYMLVYDSQRSKAFIVSSTGVYHKAEDPAHPFGEPIALAPKN